MLRVVLCIICLHPFLWLFLFALLYHTVKDFFVLILLKTCEFCIFWTFYRISWRRWEGRKTLRRGGSPLLFVGCFSREIEKGPGGGLSTSEAFHSVRNVELGINSSLRTPNSYLNRLLKVQNLPFYNCGGCYYAVRK